MMRFMIVLLASLALTACSAQQTRQAAQDCPKAQNYTLAIYSKEQALNALDSVIICQPKMGKKETMQSLRAQSASDSLAGQELKDTLWINLLGNYQSCLVSKSEEYYWKSYTGSLLATDLAITDCEQIMLTYTDHMPADTRSEVLARYGRAFLNSKLVN